MSTGPLLQIVRTRTPMNSTILILACSGPGAGQAIARNIAIGYFFAVGTGLATICYFWFRSWNGGNWPAYACATLLAFHPAWSISARRGDCGATKVMASLVVFSIAFGLLVPQVLPRIRNRTQAQQASASNGDKPSI